MAAPKEKIWVEPGESMQIVRSITPKGRPTRRLVPYEATGYTLVLEWSPRPPLKVEAPFTLLYATFVSHNDGRSWEPQHISHVGEGACDMSRGSCVLNTRITAQEESALRRLAAAYFNTLGG